MTTTSRAAMGGIAATAAALGVSELLAGLLSGAGSLVAGIGQLVIDLQPPGAKDVMVGLFGTNDKLALEIIIVIVALAIGAGLGILARREMGLASIGLRAVRGRRLPHHPPRPARVGADHRGLGGDLGRHRDLGARLADRAAPGARRRAASSARPPSGRCPTGPAARSWSAPGA